MKEKTLSKHGQINPGVLTQVALSFVILVLVIAIGGIIGANLVTTVYSQGGGSQNGSAFNITNQGDGYNTTWNATSSAIQGFQTMGQQTPLIALIAVMAFIIMMVVAAFGMRGMGGAA